MTTAEDLELSDQDKVQLWSTDSGMESMTNSNKDVTPMSENFDDDEEVCFEYLYLVGQTRFFIDIYYLCRMNHWANAFGRLLKCSPNLYEKTLVSCSVPLVMLS